MNRTALLDVNLLVALFDPDHVHHEIAHDWFADNRDSGWATCPITENGFVRVLSSPSYSSTIARPPELVRRLQVFCRSGHHEFWPCDVSLADDSLFSRNLLSTSRHITDIYLLGLAVRHGGRLATFDRSIPVGAILRRGTDALSVISDAGE